MNLGGVHVTHVYINPSPDGADGKPPPNRDPRFALVEPPTEATGTPVAFGEHTNACDAVLNLSSLVDDGGTYSCRIRVNSADTDSSLRDHVVTTPMTNADDRGTRAGLDVNANRNGSCASSEDDSCCRYSVADIDELSEDYLNVCEQSAVLRVPSNGSSCDYYSSRDSLVSDSEADGIVTFLDKSNGEVRKKFKKSVDFIVGSARAIGVKLHDELF